MTRFGYVMATYFASLGIGASALFHPLPRLIWNASASVPIGLYAVRPAGALHVTELVVVQPPEALASFLDERRYLRTGIPTLKRVEVVGVSLLWPQTGCTISGEPPHLISDDWPFDQEHVG